MKILMTGGTGFVGTRLIDRLTQEGHEITVLTRSLQGGRRAPSGVSYLEGDPTRRGPWQQAVQAHDAVINLAGASIFSKWTEEHKRAIRESRILTTQNVVEAIPVASRKPFTLFSTSAVGYYGFCGDEELTEDSPPGDDFLARIAVEWEAEALKAEEKGTRVVLTRFGIVLGEKGGALGQMIPLFKKFLGGPIGSGKQWFSWIHIEDLAEAFVFLIEHPEISGPVNLCSPNPVRNRDLAKALGEVLGRPSFMPAPAFMIKLVLGEFGSVILEGQRVFPKRLLEGGFVFKYPRIGEALRSLVGTSA
ncbi:MAG: TIGR01777 family oxidoreductase [Desulfobacterota bacterium]|nr:TIGR01777 family oxidoreductase [Thermodesulfobacteriota bacterium]